MATSRDVSDHESDAAVAESEIVRVWRDCFLYFLEPQWSHLYCDNRVYSYVYAVIKASPCEKLLETLKASSKEFILSPPLRCHLDQE